MKLSYRSSLSVRDLTYGFIFSNKNVEPQSRRWRAQAYSSLRISFSCKGLLFHSAAKKSANLCLDARSHTGIMIGFATSRGLVYFRSSVQKNWLHSMMSVVDVLSHEGNLTPIVYQDNNSAIHLAQRGPGTVSSLDPNIFVYGSSVWNSSSITRSFSWSSRRRMRWRRILHQAESRQSLVVHFRISGRSSLVSSSR